MGNQIYVRSRQAKAALNVLDTVAAYSFEELVEQFEWTEEDVTAWAQICAKLRPIAESA
jgi:hypothetical protein